MSERRKDRRRLAYIGGRASFFRREASADVLIRNMSSSGAKLIVHNGNFVPDKFNLIVPAWQGEFNARVCWRRYEEIGVKFEHALAANDAGGIRTDAACFSD